MDRTTGENICVRGGALERGVLPAPSVDEYRFKPRILLPGGTRVAVQSPSTAPWNTVALINVFFRGGRKAVGTGFLVAPDVLFTAKHTFTESKPFDLVGVWVAFDAERNVAAPVPVLAWEPHATLDLAVLILGAPQPEFLSLGRATTPRVCVVGYSIPYEDGTPHLTFGSGDITSAAGAKVLTYYISTRAGDSGAPVMHQLPSGKWVAVGVHLDAATDAAKGNGGLRFDDSSADELAALERTARNYLQAS